MSDVPQKHCPKCGKDFPATREYFTSDKRDTGGLYYLCNTCHAEKERERKARLRGEIPIQRRCSVCGEVKPLTSEFFYHKKNEPYGFGYWCKECEKRKQRSYKKQGTAVAAIDTEIKALSNGHKLPLDASKQCGSCGTTRGNIFGDVDSSTFEMYGYLCMKCYQLVRDFGNDPIRIRNVLTYIERTRASRVQ